MIVNFNPKNFFYSLFDGLNSWITKLNYLPGICHDDVVVLFIEIGLFIMCLILSKLMFANQT